MPVIRKFFLSAVFYFSLAVFSCMPASAANVNIITSDGLTDRDVTNAVRATELTGRYMFENFQRRLLTDVMLELVPVDENTTASEPKSFSKNGRIVVSIKDSTNDYRTIFLVAHELVHQYQQDVATPDTLNKNLWFTEGMADYLAMRIANQTGSDKTEDFIRQAQRGYAYDVSLAQIAPRGGWTSASRSQSLYPLADLAVIHLSQQSSEQSFFAYLLALNTHTAEESLHIVYGIKMDEVIG